MSGDPRLMPITANAHIDICDTVRKICGDFPAAYWRDLESQTTGSGYPEAFVTTLEETGIMSALVPEAYGGVGLPLTAAAAIATTIHESGCNGATFVTQAHLTELVIRLAGEDLRNRLLPKLAAGETRLQTLAISEFGVGDDISQMNTTVRKAECGYILSGRKSRACFAMDSEQILVLARTDDADGTALVLVNTGGSSGGKLTFQPFEEMNNDGSASAHFDELPIDAKCLFGGFGSGARHLAELAAVHRVLAAAVAVGDGRFFSRRAVAYANERTVFGNLIGKYQGIQFPLAKAQIEIEAAALQMLKAATLYDQGADAVGASMVARHLATEAAWAMADAAFTTHGGFAFAREYDIERKWRDVRAARITATPFNNDILRIGETMLGLPRSY